jgi:hypothetical protein
MPLPALMLSCRRALSIFRFVHALFHHIYLWLSARECPIFFKVWETTSRFGARVRVKEEVDHDNLPSRYCARGTLDFLWLINAFQLAFKVLLIDMGSATGRPKGHRRHIGCSSEARLATAQKIQSQSRRAKSLRFRVLFARRIDTSLTHGKLNGASDARPRQIL